MTANAKQNLQDLWPIFEHWVHDVMHCRTMPVSQEQLGYWIDFCAWYTEQQQVLNENAADMPGPLKDVIIAPEISPAPDD